MPNFFRTAAKEEVFLRRVGTRGERIIVGVSLQPVNLLGQQEQTAVLARERTQAWARARVWSVFGSALVGVHGASAVAWDAWPRWMVPALLVGAAVLLAGAGLVMKRSRPALWLCGLLACVLLGALAWGARVVHVPAGRLTAQARAIITVEGVVQSAPRTLQAGARAGVPLQPATQFVLAVRSVVERSANGEETLREASGTLRVRVAGVGGDQGALVAAGSRVRVMGRYEPVRPATNPGEPDRVALARARGDVGLLTLSSFELVTQAQGRPRAMDGPLRWALQLRERGKQAVLASLPSDAQARWLLSALLMGESEARDDEAMSAFARVGVIHLVAISGFHLTVIALVMLWLLRLLGDRGWLEPVLVALGLLLYASLTPLSPALVRAVVLTLLVLATQSAGRKADSLCVLGLGAFAMVLVQPSAAHDLGFQLSLGLTALLLWAQPAFAARFAGLPPKGVLQERLTATQWLWRATRTASAASVMCWVVSVPWMMASVGLVSPAGLLASLVLAPVFVVLLVVGVLAGALGAVVGAIAPEAAMWLTSTITSPVLTLLAKLVMHSVRIADGAPGAWWWAPTTPWWWAILATGVLACWARFGFGAHAARQWQSRVRWGMAGAMACTAAALPAAWHLRARLASDVVLRIDMLDVGDGSCYLVRTRENASLWDCKQARWARTQPGVLAACRELGAARVHTLLLTHPDSDHYTGAEEVLMPLGLKQVLTTQRFLDAAASNVQGPAELIASMKGQGIEPIAMREGESVAFSTNVAAQVLWPGPEPPADTMHSDNEHSLVLVLHVQTAAGPTRVLLTGDVQGAAARAIAPAVQALAPFAVVEAPHHGAADAGGIALLAAARGRVVLQSTGPSRVDDPRLAAVREASEAWLVTARDGWCSVEVLRDGSVRYGKMRR